MFELAVPRIPVVFLTAGSHHLDSLSKPEPSGTFGNHKKRTTRRCISHVSRPPQTTSRRGEFLSDRRPLATDSDSRLTIFFPTIPAKFTQNNISVAHFVFPEAERFKHLKRPFAERDIDVIFVAKQIRPTRKKLWFGQEKSSAAATDCMFISWERLTCSCPPARHHGRIVGRTELYELLGRSKDSRFCPSSLDAAPAVLFEAAAMGCNVIAAPNCGNWDLCNDRLVSENCSEKAFLSKIEMSLNAPHKDNRERFRGGYDDLVETLSVC